MLLQCGNERLSRVTVALLGRFLPRLGPLPQGERPFFFAEIAFAFFAEVAFASGYSAAARYGRNSSNGISARRSDNCSNSLASREKPDDLS
jgi:hypothetical protein